MAFPGLKETPKTWDTCSANVLTKSTQMEQSRYDDYLFYCLEPSREQVEKRAGRHIYDFLVTGPESNVEHFPAQAKHKLSMQDAVRLYRTGDEDKLLAMTLESWRRDMLCRTNPFLFTKLPQHSRWKIPSLNKNPSVRSHKTTISHLYRAIHESSKPVWTKQCTSVMIDQTFNTARIHFRDQRKARRVQQYKSSSSFSTYLA